MAHKFKHGFKAEAERYAGEFRKELGLRSDAYLCPRRLAAHLEIPIHGIKGSPVLSADIKEYWLHHPKDPFRGLSFQMVVIRKFTTTTFTTREGKILTLLMRSLTLLWGMT